MARKFSIDVEVKDDGSIRVLSRDLDKVEGSAKRADRGLAATQSRLNILKGVAVAAGAAVTAALTAIAVKSLEMAAAAQESENLFEVSMGAMAGQAREFSEEMSRSLGVSGFEARKFMAIINNMVTSMGLSNEAALELSTGVTQLAFDMSSFFDIPIAEAFQKLQSGLSGEIEPLRRLGVTVDEATVKQVAYAEGIAESGEELTQLQKVQARWQTILQQTTNAQGDLARTQDQYTNTSRRLETATEDLMRAFGAGLIPAATSAKAALADFAQDEETIEGVRSLGREIGLLASELTRIGQAAPGGGGGLAGASISVALQTLNENMFGLVAGASLLREQISQTAQALGVTAEEAESVRQRFEDAREAAQEQAEATTSAANEAEPLRERLEAVRADLEASEQSLENQDARLEAIKQKYQDIEEATKAMTEDLDANLRSSVELDDEWGDIEAEALTVLAAFTDMLTLQQDLNRLTEEYRSIWQDIAGFVKSVAANAIGGALRNVLEGGSFSDSLARAGDQIGSAAGFAIGDVLGGPFGAAIGEALGGFIGQAAGETIGGFLDDLFGSGPKVIGTIQISAGGISATGINEASQAAEAMNQALRKLEQILGTTAVTLMGVQVRIKDNGKIWVNLANGVSKAFKDLNQAINFALTEAIKGAQIQGAPQEFITALQNTQATTLEQLFRDLEVVQRALAVTTGEVTQQIRQLMFSFEQFRAELQRLGLDTSIAAQELGQSLQALRNQILGINETAEERIRRQAEQFNAEIQMIQAEQQAKIADLQIRLAVLQGQQQVVQGSLAADQAYIQGIGAVGLATVNVAQVMANAVAAINAAIAAAENILNNLPALISEEEIEKAIRNATRGTKSLKGFNTQLGKVGPTMEDAKKSIKAFLEELQGGSSLSALPPIQQIQNLRSQFLSLVKQALGGNAQAANQLPQVAQSLLSLAQQFSPQLFVSLSALVTALLNKVLGQGPDPNGFAEGGVVTQQQMAVVAEQGPEAIIPLKRGAVPVSFKDFPKMPPIPNHERILDKIHDELRRARDERIRDNRDRRRDMRRFRSPPNRMPPTDQPLRRMN